MPLVFEKKMDIYLELKQQMDFSDTFFITVWTLAQNLQHNVQDIIFLTTIY